MSRRSPLRIKSSKTDQEGWGDHVTGERLTVVSARRIIQARAHAAGVEGFISGHSLRAGSVVSLAQAGASVIDMQNAG